MPVHALLSENKLLEKYHEYLDALLEAPVAASTIGRSVAFSDRRVNEIKILLFDVADCLMKINPGKYCDLFAEDTEETLTCKRLRC